MELQELRERIDDIDEELLSVFAERMKVSAEIARVKREQGLPVRPGESRKRYAYEQTKSINRRPSFFICPDHKCQSHDQSYCRDHK